MDPAPPFPGRHFAATNILRCARWHLRYSLSYRDREEMLAKRERRVDHPTIARGVLRSAPALAQRVRVQLKPTTDSCVANT